MVTVRITPPGGTSLVLGVDTEPGAVPEGLTCSADQAGPLQCTFQVKRDTGLPWRDLLPYAEVDVEAPGAGLVWSGRVQSVVPGADGAWGVTAKGWQFHLDDDVLRRVWVHQRLEDWQDTRQYAGTPLAEYQGYLNPSGGRALTFSLGGGQTLPVLANGGRSGFFLDGGEAGAIKRVVVAWESANNTSSIQTYLIESDTDPSDDTTFTSIAVWNGGASGTFTRTLPTPRRYVGIIANNNTAGDYTPLGATWFRITRALAVRDTAYEGSNQSILTATQVIQDTLASAPLLSTDTTLIQDSGLIDAGARGIPHLTTEGGYETPRQVMQRCNAYHDWLLGVDADRRLVFAPRPTAPIAELGAWSGAEFSDAGDDAEELYNRVLVQAVDVTGAPAHVERTATSPLLDLGGATRTRILTAQAALTVAAAEVIGDAWLTRRATRPTKGSIQAAGAGALRVITSGAPVTPAETLRWPGQLVRLTDRWDPDTGAWGRDAVISQVTWTADTDQVSITLDAPKDRLDALLSRVAAVQAARPQIY